MELEEQVVIGTCQTKEGYDYIKGELMRIFEKVKEATELLKQGDKKVNPQMGTRKGCFAWRRGILGNELYKKEAGKSVVLEL